MQVDDGAKAAPEKFLNDGDDWMTIIEGSLHVIPQDHWGIGASIKVRLDGDRLIISADEPGYSESISLRIPALTTRPEPAADERGKFEEVFGPLPPDCIRVGEGYAATQYSAWQCQTYIQNWDGWKARAALQAALTAITAPTGDHIGLHGDGTGGQG